MHDSDGGAQTKDIGQEPRVEIHLDPLGVVTGGRKSLETVQSNVLAHLLSNLHRRAMSSPAGGGKGGI